MKKVHKRLISMVLVALLAAGNMVMPVSAVQHDAIENTSYYTASSKKIGTNIKPFTSTADLIKDTIKDLLKNGDASAPVSDDSRLEEMVSEKSEMTLNEALSGLGMAFFSNRETGHIDTEKYHLTKSEMGEVLERALSQFYLTDAVEYTLEIGENREVVGIDFELRDSLSVALDDIEENGSAVSSEPMRIDSEDNLHAFESSSGLHADSDVYEITVDDGDETESDKHEHSYETKYVWTAVKSEGEPEVNPEEEGGDEDEPEVISYTCYKIQVCNCGVLDAENPVDVQTVTADENGAYTAWENAASFTPVEHEHTYDDYENDGTAYWTVNEDGSYKATFAYIMCGAATETEAECTLAEVFTDDDISTTSEKEDGITTYTAFVGDKVIGTIKVAEEEPENPDPDPDPEVKHEYEITGYNWTHSYVSNGMQYTVDEDGNQTTEPVMRLVYDPDNTKGLYYYNDKVKVGISPAYTLKMDCPEISLKCTSEDCTEDHKETPETVKLNYSDSDLKYVAIDEETYTLYVYPSDVYGNMWDAYGRGFGMDINQCSVIHDEEGNVIYTNQPVGKDNMPAPTVINAPTEEDPSTYMDYMKYVDFANCLIIDNATYTTSTGDTGSVILNVSHEKLQLHWAEMAAFNRANPDYYGISTPFWTSKNTEANPTGAIKALCNMDVNDEVPDGNLDMMVEMLGQAFISYVYQYGNLLLGMLADAEAALDEDMTYVQKLLVLHDWLAKNASFDMHSLVSMKSSENSGPDPIEMTPFGALIANQIGLDGAVCLGYATAYTYLIQHIFDEYYKNDDGTWNVTDPDHIVDLVQIKFHANIEENSVAGSGFGGDEGDAIFNEPHYFNAIRLPKSVHGLSNSEDTPLDADGNCWYYTDTCYDDVYIEVITQYRVETDGAISHMYMLSSPQTLIDQFDGNYDYFDSAYDGKKYTKTDKLDDYGLPVWEMSDASDEIAYNDTQYEETWFSAAASEIVYDDGYWYYVEGSSNTYSAMKDILGDEDLDFDMGDLMGSFGDDPDYADTLMRRGREYPDTPTPKEDDSGSSGTGGIGGDSGSFDFSTYEDKYAEVLFHYGYGVARDVEEDSDNVKSPFADLLKKDTAYRDLYPDLSHTLGVYKNNGEFDKIYFNFANCIMVYDLDGEYEDANERISQLKEYNVVESYTNGKKFTGMSFFTENSPVTQADDYSFTVVNHPTTGVMINDFVYWSDGDGDGQPETRNVVPMMYVSIGTNYTQSYVIDGDIPYAKEAVNYNPSYNRYFDEDKTDDENTNVEFMWCANVVDAMPMAGILSDTNYVEVNVDATCTERSFTEPRSEIYGLSDGTTKVISDKDDRIGHHYFKDTAEDGYVCFRCNQYKTYEEVENTDFNRASLHEHCTLNPAEDSWLWSGDHEECEHVIKTCSVVDCPENEVHECTVEKSKPDDNGNVIYTATCNDCEEKSEKVTIHNHTYGEPVFGWNLEADPVTCEAVFTCEKCDKTENGHTVTLSCDDVKSETNADGDTVYTAVFNFNGNEYTAVRTVERGDVVISVSKVQRRVGNSVDVAISLDHIPSEGIAALQLALDYDKEKLELVSAEDCGILGAHEFEDNFGDIPFMMSWENRENYHTEGKLVILTFNILAEASGGDSAITLTCKACGNLGEEEYDVSISEGSIKILVPGDVNGDGKVNAFDVLRLRKYLVDKSVEIYEEVANVDGEGGIDSFDVLRLRKYVAGWDVELH